MRVQENGGRFQAGVDRHTGVTERAGLAFCWGLREALCVYSASNWGRDPLTRAVQRHTLYDDKGENDDDEEVRFGRVFTGGFGAFL